MVETVASSTSFDLPVDELITQAAAGLGGDHLTATELKRARTSLNLIFIDMQNRGMVPLASMSLVSVALASGSSMDYSFGSDVFSVLDMTVRTSTSTSTYTDLGINKIGFADWLNISNKQDTGRPTQIMVDKKRSGPFANVWPIPDSNAYSIQAWVLKRVADVNAQYQLVGTPHRYLDAIVRGLRYYLAEIRNVDINKLEWFRQRYEESLDRAMSEDRERIDYEITPHPYSFDV